jgi:hypothetical protein
MRRPLKILVAGIVILVLILLSFSGGYAFRRAVEAGSYFRSQGRFSQIKAALLMYHQDYDAFPPQKYRVDPEGPEHSWRVLLVPYTTREYRRRFLEYDFSQDWDSPANLQALDGRGQFAFFSSDGAYGTANYLTVGADERWPSKHSLRSLLVKEDDDSFLLIECPDSSIHWMRPEY